MTGGESGGFEAFADKIATRKNRLTVPVDEVHVGSIATSGGARLRVRSPGAYILECVLRTPEGEKVNVMYCGPNSLAAKLQASHLMSPVGPYDGPGGQHGPARWMDYDNLEIYQGSRPELLLWTSKRSEAPVNIGRYFRLQGKSLKVVNYLTNLTEEPVETSIGSHDYYAVPRAALGDLRINGQTMDRLFRKKGTAAAVSNGQAQYWPSFNGDAEISFDTEERHRRHIKISARGYNNHEPIDLGALLWAPRDPSVDAFCFEPTMGYSVDNLGRTRNNGIVMQHGCNAVLSTTVELLA